MNPYTVSNEQIIAELGWTRKAIKDITGVTPLYMRPPYGDIECVLFLVSPVSLEREC